MSVYTSVYALDSKIKAPEIGDNGCIGFPPVCDDGGTHDFLRVYQGLSQIGLITREMARFHAFIEAYSNEPLYFFVENDDSADAKRLDEILEEFDREGTRLPVFEPGGNESFTRAKYKISCGGNYYVSRHADYFMDTDSLTVEKNDLPELIQGVFNADDWESAFYRVWGIIDPYDGDLGNIRNFILSNPGPFAIEFLTGQLADTEAVSEANSDELPTAQAAQDGVQEEKSEAPQANRSILLKVRDAIILLFIIWVVMRALYYGFKWLAG